MVIRPNKIEQNIFMCIFYGVYCAIRHRIAAIKKWFLSNVNATAVLTKKLSELHLSLDQMVAISQTTFSNTFSWIKKNCILIRISLNFVPKGPIDNESVLVEVMAWRRTGDKPSPDPMLAQFTDASLGGGELTLPVLVSYDTIPC